MRTQLKIALYLTATNSLVLLLFGASLYYFLYNYSYTDFYKRLETRAVITARYNFDKDKINAESFKLIRSQHLEKLTQEREYIFAVNDLNDLRKISANVLLPESFLREIYENGRSTFREGEQFYAGVRHNSNMHAYLVIVSAKNYYASHHLVFLRNTILIGFLFIVVITSGLSLYFSRYIFDPIKKISKRVNQISTDNIHLRIEGENHGNEISELVSTFNDLLNRLETAFETQKNFISNASHEFGTPLTSILGEAEVTLKKERSIEEYKQALTRILGQAERINEITRSLLFLAQTAYKKEHSAFELLRTDELLWEVKQIVEKINPRSDIRIDFSLLPENPLKLKVYGNRQLLNLAFANVLTNACKYSNNQPVSVSLASSHADVIILIKDQGIGIPVAELPFIYDPFFRASNTRHYEGYGIGLPLTRNIVRIHNGSLQVTSDGTTGTTVQIKLPLAIPQAAS